MNDVPRLIGGGRTGLSTYELYLETVPDGEVPLTLAQWLDGQAATGEARTQALEAADTATTQAGIASGAAGTATTAAGTATAAAGTATTAATTAATQAGIATTQAGAATGAATAAAGFRDQAEIAATGAQVAAADAVGVYPDTATGVTETAQGVQFRTATVAELIQYRHDAGPEATELARAPTFEGLVRTVDVLSAEPVAEFHTDLPTPAWALLGDDNEVLASFPQVDGHDWIAEFHPVSGGIDYAMTDASGRVVFGWQQDGTFQFGGGNNDLRGQVTILAGDVAALQDDVTGLDAQVQSLGEAQQFGFGVFATTAAGLAATSDGDFFAVSEAGSSVFQTLYRNDAGDEEFVNRVPQPELAPNSDGLVEPGQLYRDQGRLAVRRTYGSLWTPAGNPSSFTSFGTNIFDGHLELYALYDAIMDAHPGYVSMEVLGVDGLGNQIREYTARPPAFTLHTGPWGAGDVAHPKIVLQGGIHGSERVQFFSLLQLLDDLCNRWDRLPQLAELRHGCEIVFIPTICPSGCDAATRKNHNGVDLNRNANHNWSTAGSSDPSSSNYRGPSAASEAETVIAQGLPARHPTAVGFFDFHNHTSPAGAGFAHWVGVSRPSELGAALEMLADMQVHISRDFQAFDTGGAQYSRVSGNVDGAIAGYWSNVADVPGYLHETPRWWGEVTTLDLLRHNYRATAGAAHTVWRRAMQRRLLSIS